MSKMKNETKRDREHEPLVPELKTVEKHIAPDSF